MISSLQHEGDELRFSCVPVENMWARPAELLTLVGLDPDRCMARLIRTKIHDNYYN